MHRDPTAAPINGLMRVSRATESPQSRVSYDLMCRADVVDRGHHRLVGQPHSDDEGPIAEAEQRAAQLLSDEHRFGQRGESLSIPVCIATVFFYIAFRLGEDYLLTPRIVGRAVKVPAGVTIVAVLFGAAWLGIVGALVAIPIAAAVQLLMQELLFPALDEA